MHKLKEIKGRIILFQEERIRLVNDLGRSFLLDLSHKLPITSRDLSTLKDNGIPVIVSYSGEAETETGIVESIRQAA